MLGLKLEAIKKLCLGAILKAQLKCHEGEGWQALKLSPHHSNLGRIVENVVVNGGLGEKHAALVWISSYDHSSPEYSTLWHIPCGPLSNEKQ